MHYNFAEIGKRLRSERKRLKYNQEELAAWITTHCTTCCRNTVIKWEKGRDMPDLDIMLKLCELFRCDLGYLLCEYDNRTHAGADVADATGLSTQTVEKIMNSHNSYLISGLDKLFTAESFKDLLVAVGIYAAYIQLYQKERQEVLDNGGSKETEQMFDLHTQISLIEYNLDTDFRNVIREISPQSRPQNNTTGAAPRMK